MNPTYGSRKVKCALAEQAVKAFNNHNIVEVSAALMSLGLSEKQAAYVACALCDSRLSFDAKMAAVTLAKLAGRDMDRFPITDDELSEHIQRDYTQLVG